MANATLLADGTGTTLTGTSANDTITVDLGTVHAAAPFDIKTGGGSDTIIFDDVLSADGTDGFSPDGTNSFVWENTAVDYEKFNLTGVETIVFTNGTITSNASVTPETLLAGPNTGDITALGEDVDGLGAGTDDFDLSTLLTWDGSTLTSTTGWTIESIEGQASAIGSNISIIEDGVVQGLVRVNGANDGINVTAENAFHTALDMGEVATMEIDVVLTDGTDSFAQTLTVDVVGEAGADDNTFTGTDADDGTFANPGIIDGLAGDDVLTGNGGDDVLFGGEGNDRLWAGLTDDGDDISIGGNGDDKVGGGAGDDLLIGDGHQGAAAGTTFGAAADDGADDLFGADGDDIIIGGTFDHNATGVDANAYTSVLGGTPILDGAAAFSSTFLVTGTAGDKLWAGAGDDQVIGAGGDDRIGLGDGDDRANGQGGADEIFSGAGADVVDGGAGDDEIYGGAGIDTLSGGADNDTVYGGDDGDSINGDAGNDTLYGEAGNDTIEGDAGTDTINGGTGDDILNGDSAGGGDGVVDTFVFVDGDGDDTINDFEAGTDLIDLSGAAVSNFGQLLTVDDGTDFIVFYGESDSITLTGESGNIGGADFIF